MLFTLMLDVIMRIILLLLCILTSLSCTTTRKETNSEQLVSSTTAVSDITPIIMNKKEEETNKKWYETQCSELIKDAILSMDSIRILHLLDSGCNVNSIDQGYEDELYYPLYWAVKSKEVKLVKLLIKNGANPDINLKRTLSPIQLATFSHIPQEIFYELVKHDLDINTYNGWAVCETPLSCAIGFGSVDIAKKIVELGATLDPDSINGFTSPLYIAAMNNKWDFFEYLLESGADPNSKFSLPNSGDCMPCPEGITILHVAGGIKDASRAVEMISTLLEFGANLNMEDDEGYNALEHNAAWANPDVIEFLINHGAIIEEGINNAAYFQNYEVVKVMLENGADPNQVSNYYSPLDGTLGCCGDGLNGTKIEPRLKVAKLLLEYGAVPRDSNQLKSLHESFIKYNIE